MGLSYDVYAGVGVRRVPVVSKCECVGGCHRLPHYEEVTVYGEGGSQRQGEEEEEEEELGSGVAVGQGDDKWLVDVGRCAGKCPQTEQQCIP